MKRHPGLAAVFGLFGWLMWLDPYLAPAVGLAITLYMIRKRY